MVPILYAMLICCIHSLPVPPGPADITSTLSCFQGEYTSTVPLQHGSWWFKLDLSETQTVEFSDCNSDFDTVMRVFDESMNAISNAYCDGDDCGDCGFNERFTIPNMSQGIYYVRLRVHDTVKSGSGYLSIVTDGCSLPTTNTFCCGCTTTQSGIGCSADQACQTHICNVDSWCCATQWDDICAGAANDICLMTSEPTINPTTNPTVKPSPNPTVYPSAKPTEDPTINPTATPTAKPTYYTTADPTTDPTANPSVQQTSVPTMIPTVNPTIKLTTVNPSMLPSLKPTPNPTENPTAFPTVNPTMRTTASTTETGLDSVEIISSVSDNSDLGSDAQNSLIHEGSILPILLGMILVLVCCLCPICFGIVICFCWHKYQKRSEMEPKPAETPQKNPGGRESQMVILEIPKLTNVGSMASHDSLRIQPITVDLNENIPAIPGTVGSLCVEGNLKLEVIENATVVTSPEVEVIQFGKDNLQLSGIKSINSGDSEGMYDGLYQTGNKQTLR